MTATALPRVWLLGDSIRMSYQPLVTELLAGRVEVVGPADNCQYALYTLTSLDRWHDELGPPDLVHWNNGLHDLMHHTLRWPVQMPLEGYVANLGHILPRLRALTPRLIFATSTPVYPGGLVRPNPVQTFHNADVEQYNRAAVELMAREGVVVHDLYQVVWAQYGAYLAADQVHLTSAGQRAAAQAVTVAVLAGLAS
jgi:hypothetical protein